MAIEVEQKFRVTDQADLERKLISLGIGSRETATQVDRYFAHPQRDFASTDEALRLRRVGDVNYITYKGPKLDATNKTRHEIELALAPGPQAAADAAELLQSLGFTPVGEVRKQRVHGDLRWQGREVGVALDHVADLGNFIELEIVTDAADMAAAGATLASLSAELGLTTGERRSYLEMLLGSRQ